MKIGCLGIEAGGGTDLHHDDVLATLVGEVGDLPADLLQRAWSVLQAQQADEAVQRPGIRQLRPFKAAVAAELRYQLRRNDPAVPAEPLSKRQ